MGNKHKKTQGRPRAEMRIKAEAAACKDCGGRSYQVKGTSCKACGRRRNTNVCPGCGGMPERVEGTKCRLCGTLAGKNQEYQPPPRSFGAVKMDGL